MATRAPRRRGKGKQYPRKYSNPMRDMPLPAPQRDAREGDKASRESGTEKRRDPNTTEIIEIDADLDAWAKEFLF